MYWMAEHREMISLGFLFLLIYATGVGVAAGDRWPLRVIKWLAQRIKNRPDVQSEHTSAQNLHWVKEMGVVVMLLGYMIIGFVGAILMAGSSYDLTNLSGAEALSWVVFPPAMVFAYFGTAITITAGAFAIILGALTTLRHVQARLGTGR